MLELLEQQKNFVPMDIVRVDALEKEHPLRANIQREHVVLFQRPGAFSMGFERRFVQWARSVHNLKQILDEGNPDPYSNRGYQHQEAAIKRFELGWELCWKMLQKIIEGEGLPASGPRPVMQNAFQLGLLPETFLWQTICCTIGHLAENCCHPRSELYQTHHFDRFGA